MPTQFLQMSWFELEVAIKYIFYTFANSDDAIFTASFEKLFTSIDTKSLEFCQLSVYLVQSLTHFVRLASMRGRLKLNVDLLICSFLTYLGRYTY